MIGGVFHCKFPFFSIVGDRDGNQKMIIAGAKIHVGIFEVFEEGHLKKKLILIFFYNRFYT